jgi:glycosyltransferase involved in cell wall biosynthesis
MKIMLTGAAPWCNGSYGKPMRYVIPRLSRAGFECALACFYGFAGGVSDTGLEGESLRLYPMVRNKYLNDIIKNHLEDWQAEALISFSDVWPMVNWGYPQSFVWIPWMPVDTDPVNAKVLEALEGAFAPCSYSKWGRDRLHEAGWPTARWVPLGVDLDVYKPMPRGAAKQALGFPPDKFIAGMVAGNASYPSRKNFPEVLQAWRQWLDKGNDGILYLHTTITPSRDYGVDFQTMLEQLHLEWSTIGDPLQERFDRATVIFSNQYRQWVHAVTDEQLAQVYNAMDVLLSPSQAEGFGLPILEAQACGVPVVTLNATGMKDITFAGICIEPSQPVWEVLGGWRAVAPVNELVDAIGWAQEMSQGENARQYLAEKARVGASAYSWDDVVGKYLMPVLDELK